MLVPGQGHNFFKTHFIQFNPQARFIRHSHTASRIQAIDGQLDERMYYVPNLPDAAAPDGTGEHDNVVLEVHNPINLPAR